MIRAEFPFALIELMTVVKNFLGNIPPISLHQFAVILRRNIHMQEIVEILFRRCRQAGMLYAR